jgi:hypothetical protein
MAKGKADAWLTCNKGEEDNSVDQACKRLVAGIYIFEAVSTYCSAGIQECWFGLSRNHGCTILYSNIHLGTLLYLIVPSHKKAAR